MISYLKQRSKVFYDELLSNLFFIAILVAYILLKAISNLTYGASYFTAFRSGIMGVIMYVAGMYAVNLASNNTDENKQSFRMDTKVAKRGLAISAVYFLFLFTTIIDNLQRKNILSGAPVLSFLPGYNRLILAIESFSQSVSEIASFVLPEQIKNIILGNLIYVLIPLIIFKLSGYRFKGFFSLKNTRASRPILGIYFIMFFSSGVTVKKFGVLFTAFFTLHYARNSFIGVLYSDPQAVFLKKFLSHYW